MRHQSDTRIRAVSFDNLQAMCSRASGMSHRFTAYIHGSRCILEYSNPDEYGNELPYSVSLPLLRTKERDNPDVLFHVLTERGRGLDSNDKESAFQAIESLILSAPILWRKTESGEWLTRFEYLAEQGRKDFCTTGGATRLRKEVDGTYTVITYPAGIRIASGMTEADAEVLQRALFMAQQENGSPDAWNPHKESAS